MSKLNQIIAVANGKKTKCANGLTELYKKIQKAPLFDGIQRTYQPLDEEGETFPPEKKNIQMNVASAIEEAKGHLSELLDIVATQDWANCTAMADVVVDGQTVLNDVPVTHLLFLEKQLVDVQTFVNHLPTLDPAENWTWNDAVGAYVSDMAKTNKTKKVLRNHVKAEATKEHPAQVETYSEDVKVGEWSTVKYSGAIPMTKKTATLQKIAKLIDAVKFAREQANSADVKNIKTSDKLFSYIF